MFASLTAAITSSALPTTVGVIGGGVAGVTAARTLMQAGLSVVLHERDDRLGGRLGAISMAGGRTAGAACSYLKAKHPDFVQMLESWASEGLVAEWRDPKPHIISAPGVWAPLAIPADERWFAGRPDMGSPVQLNDAERSRIRICRGDVFDANYEHSKWVVATQPPAPIITRPQPLR